MTDGMKRQFTRREFLTRSALAAAAPALLSVSRAESPIAPQRIIVIGAGLAGLAAAYELTRVGHEVRVIEAQSRAGGRVLTLREPFPEGLIAEAGATRIHLSQDRVIRYARLFNLKLSGFYPNDDHFVRVRGGRRDVVRWRGLANEVEKFAIRLERPNQWLRIDGGNDQLPQAFARALA